ncbi:hypothetical protein [Demequina salsinemoris]|uniref:hypothetical protein n=1 Tax=Demequina salsinemoris TaxID=577470 RepID=UPI000B131970|nr:hypothetical protein [Demequina salsinemoris]
MSVTDVLRAERRERTMSFYDNNVPHAVYDNDRDPTRPDASFISAMLRRIDPSAPGIVDPETATDGTEQ